MRHRARARTVEATLALAACAAPGGSAATGATATSGTSGEATTDHASATTTASTDESESTSGGLDPSEQLWADFLGHREEYLVALAEPISDCIVREDTTHPAFHGCIDWHSAVHATYSLLAISRCTGDPQYRALADETLDPAALDAELARVVAGDVSEEIPYGYAWFLALAIERENGGDEDLVPLADEVAAQLRTFIEGRSEAQVSVGVLADDYENISWAVLNLWQWGRHVGDTELTAAMAAFTEDRIMTPALDAACPLVEDQQDTDDFFPPCLHRLRTIVTVLPPEVHRPWLEQYLYASWDLDPLTEIGSAHQGGLNFSRAWGLWAAFVASDNTGYRDLHVEHVVTHVMQPQYWAESYLEYSHWVAQFGVYAIALSWE